MIPRVGHVTMLVVAADVTGDGVLTAVDRSVRADWRRHALEDLPRLERYAAMAIAGNDRVSAFRLRAAARRLARVLALVGAQ